MDRIAPGRPMFEPLTARTLAQAPDPLGDLTDTDNPIPYGYWIAVAMFALVGGYLIVGGIRGRRHQQMSGVSRGSWLQIGLGIFFLVVATVIALLM
jgi:hypothetical protein